MITKEEFEAIGNSLESHHAIFYALFQFSKITFDPKIDTAAIIFSENGDAIDFCFNPDFWKSRSEHDRLFVICHECLHVIFNHGFRIKSLNPKIANIAADIVVNHYLINYFGFNKYDLANWESLCWVDTIFGGSHISDTETFEFYYSLLMDNIHFISQLDSLDNHSGLGGAFKNNVDIEDGQANVESFMKKVSDLLGEDDKEELEDIIEKEGGRQAGAGFSNGIWKMPTLKQKPRTSWKKIVKKWQAINKHAFDDSEQWARMNRRGFLLDKNLIIPSEMEHEGDEENKINAWLYLDVSGSCSSFKPYFWKAADSIPLKFFNLKMFTFSTKVFDVDMKNRVLRGGGGTSFSCINNHVNGAKLRGEKPPHIIMVITDGHGNRISPKDPKKWHWFIKNGSTALLPRESFNYKLENFMEK